MLRANPATLDQSRPHISEAVGDRGHRGQSAVLVRRGGDQQNLYARAVQIGHWSSQRLGGAIAKVASPCWSCAPSRAATSATCCRRAAASRSATCRGTNPQIEREDAPGIVITRDVEDDPVQIWTKGAAAAMPVLYSPDCHIAATVL